MSAKSIKRDDVTVKPTSPEGNAAYPTTRKCLRGSGDQPWRNKGQLQRFKNSTSEAHVAYTMLYEDLMPIEDLLQRCPR